MPICTNSGHLYESFNSESTLCVSGDPSGFAHQFKLDRCFKTLFPAVIFAFTFTTCEL